MSSLRIDQVTASSGDPPMPVLRKIRLAAESVEILALFGPSGCGTATLLRSTNRLIAPPRGRFELGGRDSAIMDPVQLPLTIGYVAQGAALFPHWTVAENIGTVPRLLNCHRTALPREWTQCWTSSDWVLPRIETGCPRAFPAANSNASAWPAPWLKRPSCS